MKTSSMTAVVAVLLFTTAVCAAPVKVKGSDTLAVLVKRWGEDFQKQHKGSSVVSAGGGTNTGINALLTGMTDIATGAIMNWSDVGGPDAPIHFISREPTSGTRDFLKDTLLKKADFADNVVQLPGTAAVVVAVARDPYAIGYGGVAYGREGVKELALKVDGEDVPPTAEHVKSGRYPLTRDLFFYLRSEATGETKKFVDYVLSEQGQAQTLSVGYFATR